MRGGGRATAAYERDPRPLDRLADPSGFISFAVGAAVLLALWALADGTGMANLDQVPGRACPGGLYSATLVCSGAFAALHLGLGTTMVLMIAWQLLVAVTLDHLGVLGLGQARMTPEPAFGMLLVLAGAKLVRR